MKPVVSILGAVTGLALLYVAAGLAHQVEPQLQLPTGLSTAQQERLDQSATASLFGQFRTSFADFLWLKSDRYLHNGVDMRGLTRWEKQPSGTPPLVGNASGTEEGDREHHSETTVVPAAGADWRGWFGDMERQIKPFQDMRHHKHRDPKEALPLFRLMTWSNPHFVSGYTVGAAMIARDHSKYQEAIDFLREGLKNNPRSIEIESAIGGMLTAKQKRYDAAMPYLTRALALAKQRDRNAMTEDELDAWQYAVRWAVLNRRSVGDDTTARSLAEAGLHDFPQDVVCLHYLQRKKSHE